MDLQKYETENKEISSKELLRLQRQLEQERRLFEMKWKILEQELINVAAEKRQLESEREECRSLQSSFHYEIFFIGVNSKQSLKKRYRELMKIFHPDNMNGDTSTLQEINREYEALKQRFE